jgi:hypothetical protein
MSDTDTTIRPALGAGRAGGYEWENRQAVRTVYDGPPLRSAINGDVMGRHGDHVTMRREFDGRLAVQQCIGSAQPYECATVRLRPETLDALAALALYGRPSGFTHEDVDALEAGIGALGVLENIADEHTEAGRVLAERAVAKLRALLPPKTP